MKEIHNSCQCCYFEAAAPSLTPSRPSSGFDSERKIMCIIVHSLSPPLSESPVLRMAESH